ncbi:uncharacterized protein [Apostichopus japonicus]|uniref:uncharacterized protein n=1 Tax=Stichopus japonicus TaxID=307972 RepID=UPI003AB673F8
MAILKFLALAVMIVCVKGEARPARQAQCDADSVDTSFVESLISSIPVESDGSEESDRLPRSSTVCPATFFENPCPSVNSTESIIKSVNRAGQPVKILWPKEFNTVVCCKVNDCSKCIGNCTQQYKYECAVVINLNTCRVVWDWVKVKSGCCCHQFESC